MPTDSKACKYWKDKFPKSCFIEPIVLTLELEDSEGLLELWGYSYSSQTNLLTGFIHISQIKIQGLLKDFQGHKNSFSRPQKC